MALTPEKRAGSDEAFLREVDDAVRAGNLTSYWEKYGKLTLGLIVAGLVAFAGWIWWSNHQQSLNEKQGEEFVEAMDKLKAGDEKGARDAFAKISKADQPGYRAMAQLMEANILAQKQETKKAVAAYAKVAADDSLPDLFRNLALIRQTATEFDTLAPQAVIDRLKPLAKPGDPWFGSAGEMTAIAYLKMGKDNLAGPIFAQIAKQDGLPQTQRSRAQQMAGALGIDTVQVNEKGGQASAAGQTPAKGE